MAPASWPDDDDRHVSNFMTIKRIYTKDSPYVHETFKDKILKFSNRKWWKKNTNRNSNKKRTKQTKKKIKSNSLNDNGLLLLQRTAKFTTKKHDRSGSGNAVDCLVVDIIPLSVYLLSLLPTHDLYYIVTAHIPCSIPHFPPLQARRDVTMATVDFYF